MKQEIFIRAEKYLSGDLTRAEHERFEEELMTNESLQVAVREVRQAMDLVDKEIEQELTDKFKTWSKEPSRKQRVIPISIAASVALLVISYFLFVYRPSLTPKELAMDYYARPNAPGLAMGQQDEYWVKGSEAYRKGNYEQALANWQLLVAPSYEQQYYLAHAFFMTKHYLQSAEIFLSLKDGASAYSFLAEWNLALVYLANEDLENFNQVSRGIIESLDHPYYSDIQSIIRKVEEID